ncbi:ATP-binding protein [Patescibacteria group bacterium]|nr:ATP-binding protein [Patescibacteria group bacterium]
MRLPQEKQRKKLLNILLLVVSLCALLGFVSLILFQSELTLTGQWPFLRLYLCTLVGSAIIYVINRYGSCQLASLLFLILLIVGVTLFDKPLEVVEGRALLGFAPLIIIGSVILPPYFSFIVAGLSSLVITVIAFSLGIFPNPFTIILFFIIALISWLSAHDFQRVLENLQGFNRELDRIAKMLVRRDLELSSSKEELSAEKGKIDAVIYSLTDGLIMVDGEEKTVLFNPKAKIVLGIKKEEHVLGKTLSELARFTKVKKLYQVLGGKVEWTGKQYELIVGEYLKRFLQVSISPVVTQSQETIGFLIILHDITREKEIERMKTEFVSIAAHQLRTPLSTIKWALRIVLDGDVGKLAPKQTEILESGYQSNERMIALINDLLNIARIEEGRFLYEFSPHSLEDLVKKIIDNLASTINEKKIKLIFKKTSKPLPSVKIDVEKMELAVHNLLDNAIGYSSDSSEITVSINRDKKNIKVMVSDNGIGIFKQQQKQVFTKFFRGNNAIKTGREGSGLGLFITKNIIEEHGGKIWFESKKGKGSTFWFTLPIKR